MDNHHSASSASSTDALRQSSKSDRDPIGHNIESILAIHARDEQLISRSQRMLETMLDSMGQPIYLCIITLLCIFWILANVILEMMGLPMFDAPPFHWLQGIIGLLALLIMIIVLIKQNRLAKIDERRAHLELQVNLLTEQKTSKLIKLLVELRRDLPMIKNRQDPEAAVFQKPTNPEAVLAALDEHIETETKKV